MAVSPATGRRMPKKRPLNVHRETARNGETIWYHRIGKGPRTRLRAPYGSKAFYEELRSAAAGAPVQYTVPKAGVGSTAWAIRLYRGSKAWEKLSPATRKQRSAILDKITMSDAGDRAFAGIDRRRIEAGIDARSASPAAARHFLQTMRGLFVWAVKEDIVSANPTTGLVALAASTEGHPVWDHDDIAAFEARWPIGTRERVAFAILLYTGLRRGDAVRLGRQHVRAGIIRMKTEKTGERVTIVMDAELVAILEAGPCGDLAYIAGEKGLPRVKESFGDWFRQACDAAGVKKSAHGLRKSAATRAAENGATERQLEAMFGWRGGRMASHYTRSADRERLSIEGAALLARPKS